MSPEFVSPEFASRSALIALLLVFQVCTVAWSGQPLPQQFARNAGCGTIGFLTYRPREPHDLDELAPLIRRKLFNHLVEKLGERFVTRLKLAGGQIIDVNELYRVEPEARRFKWKIPTYNLFLSFSLPEKGISSYCVEIEMDRNGDLLKEFALPPMRRLALKQEFISLRQAYGIAERAGFNITKTGAELGYDGAIESITYHLQQRLRPIVHNGNSYGDVVRQIYVDAHSGRVLKINTESRYE